jgi:hypothetical protein
VVKQRWRWENLDELFWKYVWHAVCCILNSTLFYCTNEDQ